MVERAPAKPAGVVTYVSTAPAYVGGDYVEPGKRFSTDARPGAAWTAVKPGAPPPRPTDSTT
ncbi:MAG: hypothetical protein WC804_14850 [Sphingomonas sp.]|jgi:hypothetical protein|uniref:hypothetical protein n=1 Tax=Sphingomonas sp. TaxID=28214 RepID=UPI00356A2672